MALQSAFTIQPLSLKLVGVCQNTKEIHTSASQEHRDLQAFGSYDWQLRAQAFESSLPKSGVKSLI